MSATKEELFELVKQFEDYMAPFIDTDNDINSIYSQYVAVKEALLAGEMLFSDNAYEFAERLGNVKQSKEFYSMNTKNTLYILCRKFTNKCIDYRP